jgi:hypothetical protein
VYKFLPGLPDGRNDDVDDEESRLDLCKSGEEIGKEVYWKSYEAKSFLFVMDEEAMRTGYIRLLWLGVNGEVVWENRNGDGRDSLRFGLAARR